MTYVTNSPAETEALGQRLAETLQPGDVIAYTGDLGAGKTAFTRGLARGLGITEPRHQPHLYHRQRVPGRSAAPVPL